MGWLDGVIRRYGSIRSQQQLVYAWRSGLKIVMLCNMKMIRIFALYALIATIGALLVSCGETSYEKQRREREDAALRKEQAIAGLVGQYFGAKKIEDVDWGGDLTIQMQRYVAQNKGAVYYFRPYFFDLADEGGSVLLTFSDYPVHYRIRCEEEQLTSLLRDKDASNGDWLVFFSITDFRRPTFSLGAEVLDDYDADILLEESDTVIAIGRLVGIHNIDSAELLGITAPD